MTDSAGSPGEFSGLCRNIFSKTKVYFSRTIQHAWTIQIELGLLKIGAKELAQNRVTVA